ncbi:MAG: hypothetical protein AB8B52_09360 [Winogradskyella sp.]|uniref:hypothetical protein n=1 Tax=Winogradskyella sp. TaxID=1883156 RepID=UPI00385FEF59
MKTALIFILFLTMSLTGFAQQEANVTADDNVEIVETSEEVKVEASNAAISAEVKAKVLKLNRKKSNEIISIKAYRKSLQIKVKTIKLC